MSNDYFKAQGWFKDYARNSQDSRGMFQRLVEQDEREFKIASAETDRIKAMINKKYGPGSMKYGSEIPQPEIKIPQAIFEFTQRNPAAEGGQMVQPSVDGSRPGYSGDYTAEEMKKQGRTKVLRNGRWVYDLHTPEIKKWYKKNYPDKSWWDQKYKPDILDRYYNELGREKPPKGYITTKEYAKKYGFKIYPATDVKAEGNIISNILRRQGDERQLTRNYNEPTKNFFTNELEPKFFKTTYELAPGKKSSRELLYVKDKGKIHAKNLLKYWDGTQLRDHTIKNINNLLKDNSIKKLFEAGDYDGIKKALMNVKGITDAERASVMLRIAQGMSGHSFRDYEPDIKLNKVAANKIFKGFEKEPWHTPFSDGYMNIKRDAIMKDLGDGYFTKSYKGFVEDARAAIKKSFPSLDISNIDINELTGLTSGYKNKTFTSTQFVNLMDSNFNQRQHANLMKNYGQHEARLQTALSGKRPNYDAAANEVKKWKAWKKNWFDNLDPRYKTDKIKSILPDFKITDKASQAFTEKRLAEFRKQNFPIAEEIKQKGYIKTFGTKKSMSETPLLKEIASGDSKAIERFEKQMIDYVTDTTGKVKQPMLPSGLAGVGEMLSDDLKALTNSEAFKTWKAKIANPALKSAMVAAKLPTKIFGAADLVLGYLDYANNRQKGFSKEDSTRHMVDAVLFGATSFGEKGDIEGVKKIAMQNGMSEEVFNNLVSVNLNQKAMIDRINESKAKFNESMDIIESGVGDTKGEQLLIQKLKVDTKKFLTNTMKDIVDDSRSLNTNLQVEEAGAPIDINVDKQQQKAYSDLGSASREFVQKRIDASDLEKIASQKDTTKGGIGDAVMSGVKGILSQGKFAYDLLNPFSPLPKWDDWKPKDLKYKEQMEKLKKEDPTMYYKMLMSEGVDPRINLNIPVQLEFEQKYPQFGSQYSDALTQNKAEGGITGLRSKYEYKK